MAALRERRTLILSLAGLLIFLAWQAWRLGSYSRIEKQPPAWDQAVQLEIALDYRDALAAGRWSDVWLERHKSGMPPFPPLYQLALSAAYGYPDPASAALWVNWGYLVVLCVSILGLAWEFCPDDRAAAAAIIFCCAPVMQELLATQLVDLSVTAWAAAAYWALVRSRGFSRWAPSLAFGALFAAGMLHK